MPRPTPPSRLQERRHAGSRREILEAARSVLARAGVPGLTQEAVARELGVTKQALYHYFPSKNALLFEVVLEEHAAAAEAVHTACAAAPDGPSAIEALIRAYVAHFAGRLDAFRLITLQVQFVDAERMEPEIMARFRSPNDRTYGAAEEKLRAEWRGVRGVKRGDARRLVFTAHLAAMGLLTMKALVERFEDPLRHRDDELVAELCGVFRPAAKKEKSP